MKVNKTHTKITVKGRGVYVDLIVSDALDRKIIKLAFEMAKRREQTL